MVESGISAGQDRVFDRRLNVSRLVTRYRSEKWKRARTVVIAIENYAVKLIRKKKYLTLSRSFWTHLRDV